MILIIYLLWKTEILKIHHYSRLYEIKTILGKWFLLQIILVRMNVLTDDGYDHNKIETFDHSKLDEKGYMQSQRDWKNIEMTGYIKLNKFDINKENGEFQWYNRGELHDNIECEGLGYKGNLFFDGKTRFAKEQWHGSYDFVDKKDGSEKDLKGKWIGYKYIVYNIEDKKKSNLCKDGKLDR